MRGIKQSIEEVYPNDKATQEWLKAQKKNTQKTYKALWKIFLKFTGKTGDQILEDRKADKDFGWEKRVLEFKDRPINEKKWAEGSTSTTIGAVRSFFSYHRLELKFRRTERTKLHEAKPKYEDYRFVKEDLKQMCDFANLQEKYIITAGKSFGLRAGDFSRLTRGDLEPYLDRPVPISIGEYVTIKEHVKAFPFIDADAQPIIKLMIQKMDREGRTQPTDRILKFKKEIELSRVLRRVADKAGIKYGSKRIRFHCLRKFLVDRLSSHMSESKWKQIVGKKISEGAYVSPDNLRNDYSRVMNDTCFGKTVLEGDVEKIAKKQVLLALAKNMGIGEGELKGMFGRSIKTLGRDIEFLEKLIEARRREQTKSQDCPNGGNCGEEYRQIPETNLLEYLREGWTIVHKLANGEVIVRR